MNRLKQKVEAIMGSHASYPLFSLATLLHAGSLLYGRVSRKRQDLFDNGGLSVFKLPCPVVSIGNITVGGTGKTPMTLHLAQLLIETGYKVVVLSRGYKGRSEKYGAVVSDGHQVFCDVRQAGDEPLLMANILPRASVLVGRNRWDQGTRAIEKFNPDVILLDDGFQHRQLARDLDLLILDAQAPFGNSFLLPRGNLREPISALSRADAVIFTRCNGSKPRNFDDIENMVAPKPVFCTEHRTVMRGTVPAGRALGALDWSSSILAASGTLAGRKVAAFSGLANNRQFWDTISSIGGRLSATVGFDDHHAYRHGDLERIHHIARSADCDCLVTTEKDLVRMPKKLTLSLDLIVLGVSIDFGKDEASWRQFVKARIQHILTKDN